MPSVENVTEMPKPATWYILLQISAMLMLTVGFAAPWIYGPIGKTNNYGWQPVITAMSFIIPLFLLIIGAVIDCYTYLELVIKSGKPVLGGVLRWGGTFFLLVLIIPLILWLSLDFTGRSATPQVAIDSLGWGVWLTLAGLILQIVLLRLRIREIERGLNDG
jgi:divalent metal cation (Fe/Co/Zn/Cd) transporter